MEESREVDVGVTCTAAELDCAAAQLVGLTRAAGDVAPRTAPGGDVPRVGEQTRLRRRVCICVELRFERWPVAELVEIDDAPGARLELEDGVAGAARLREHLVRERQPL